MHPHLRSLALRVVQLFVVGAFAGSAAIWAQDVIVTAPQWFDENNVAGDQLPQFKHRPSLRYPRELKKTDEQGYALMGMLVTPKGRGASLIQTATHPYFANEVESSAGEFALRPAVKDGQPVDSICWYAVIFNPASAKAGQPEVRPRLLAVAPVIMPAATFGTVTVTALPIFWGTVKLDDKGEPMDVVLESQSDPQLLAATKASLKKWRFEPARHAGLAVAADVRVPFIAAPVPAPQLLSKVTPPKVIRREPPIYPFAMRASGFRGSVTVEFTVQADGTVANAVINRSDNPAFDESALEAIRKWKFHPAMENGRPVNTRMLQPISFSLTGDGGDDAYTVRGKTDQSKLPPELQFDVPAKVRGTIVPVYPYELRRDGVRGKVRAGMLIDDHGRVVGVKIGEASRPEFALALTAALEMFSFDPALKNGKPTLSLLAFEQAFDGYSLPDAAGEALLRTEKKHPEKIVSASALDAPVKPISRRAPIFPTSLREKVPQGEATLEIIIDSDGYVRLPRIVSATEPAFGYAAIQAVTYWRFEPPKVKGKPVTTRIRAPFGFRMQDENAAPEPSQPGAADPH